MAFRLAVASSSTTWTSGLGIVVFVAATGIALALAALTDHAAGGAGLSDT